MKVGDVFIRRHLSIEDWYIIIQEKISNSPDFIIWWGRGRKDWLKIHSSKLVTFTSFDAVPPSQPERQEILNDFVLWRLNGIPQNR